MKVCMVPYISDLRGESGINTVIRAYFKHLPNFGVELVNRREATSYDILAIHAGATTDYENSERLVALTHGLYWSADYLASDAEYMTNARVIDNVRHANEITVPSEWVAETYQRDMRLTPYVIPHGIDWGEWQHGFESDGFILWNKNRNGVDVCDASPVKVLAKKAPSKRFVTTFAPQDSPSNVHVTGVVPYDKMRRLIQHSTIYLSTVKETFGLSVLESMAAGKPILGFAHGGILDLVKHGVNGYLASPGDYDELVEGLGYCLAHAKTLGANSREMAKAWTWEAACGKLLKVFEQALHEESPTVGIVIPTYNYGDKVGRAVESAMTQTYSLLTDIVVVDDGTQDGGLTESNVKALAAKDKRIRYIRQSNKGVAVARNKGIANLNTKYVCCLDADDAIKPEFLSRLISVLEEDRSLGLAYSNLYMMWEGKLKEGHWPGECDFDQQLKGKNQIPTCCVFRREAWRRLGGYRQRYAPKGCGAEDAEFWTRMGAYGWGMERGTQERLFLYTLGGNTTGNRDYEEPNWIAWHPWTTDEQHPFASIATPVKASHPVRQYDQPTASVVIPVGPGHERHVVDALDSLEAQTFRGWEAIVTWDNAERDVLKVLQKAYPYVTWVVTEGGNGAGKARNLGAAKARGQFLLFLDADDWLLPTFLVATLQRFNEAETDVGIYTDHFGISTVDNPADISPTLQRNIREWNGREAIIEYHPAEYNWEKAVKQPMVRHDDRHRWLADPYIWCTITTLIPTVWFDEIGGFDEEMESWEDWDFWLRLARAGKCFVKVPEPLMVYRLHAGFRREAAKSDDEKWLRLATHMHEKYTQQGEPKMCRDCGGRRKRVPMMPTGYSERQAKNMPQARQAESGDEKILIRYIRARRGQHSVVGAATKEFYGYRDYGDVFEVYRADYELASHWFQPVSMSTQEEQAQVAIRQPQAAPTRLPPPPKSLRGIEVGDAEDVAVEDADVEQEVVEEPKNSLAQAVEAIMGASKLDEIEPVAKERSSDEYKSMLDLSASALPSMPPSSAMQLGEMGITKAAQLVDWSLNDLMEIGGIGPTRAQRIRDVLDAVKEGV